MLTHTPSRKTLSLQPRAALILVCALVAGCPDSVEPPKKPPPGPNAPDAPRVPAPKAQKPAFHAAAANTALTVVPQSGQDSTLKRPP